MNPELDEMLDHHRIRKVLAEYCRGSDRLDEPRMSSVYATESWDEHGMVAASGPDFVKLMGPQIRDTTETLSHLLGQSVVTVDGDNAGAETYFFAVAIGPDDAGVRCCNQLGGRFVDRLVRENGSWKIKHRIAMRDWSVAIPLDRDWETSRSLTTGSRSAIDPSYAVLGEIFGASFQ